MAIIKNKKNIKNNYRNIFIKLKNAFIEKRFVKSCFCSFLRIFLPKQKSFKVDFLCDYLFGKKELKNIQKYIDDINKKTKNTKIKVVFICWMTEMWISLRTVYEELSKNTNFDVLILAQPHTTDIKYMKGKNPAYDFLVKLYGKRKVINAFENNSWFDLKLFNPDYVFYSYPYEIYHYENYKSSEVRKYSKICLIQYAYNFETDATFCASHNFQFVKNVSIHFVANKTIKYALQRLLKNDKSEYPKILDFGYPRFDILNDSSKNIIKTCVLWTPRWTSPDRKLNKQSHFLTYYKKVLTFAKEHQEISIIIRPHPLMFGNFLQKGVMTASEINTFKLNCNKLTNVKLDESADYLNSLNKASIIITDFSSLLADYFITGKPIIYCDGSRGFSKEALIIDKSLYHETEWNGILNRLTLLLSGIDEMKENRKEALCRFLPNGKGQSSNKIMSFLEEDYFGKNY